jgi:hypothetical protein
MAASSPGHYGFLARSLTGVAHVVVGLIVGEALARVRCRRPATLPAASRASGIPSGRVNRSLSLSAVAPCAMSLAHSSNLRSFAGFVHHRGPAFSLAPSGAWCVRIAPAVCYPICYPIKRHRVGRTGIVETDSLNKSILEVTVRHLLGRREAKYHTGAAMPCACVAPATHGSAESFHRRRPPCP